MTVRMARFVSIAVIVVLISMPLLAQDKKADGKQQLQNIQGTVANMSKDTSTITVRTTGTQTRLVVYNAKTKFLYGHSDNAKAGSIAQVKDTFYISCAGTFDAKSQLVASECVYREVK